MLNVKTKRMKNLVKNWNRVGLVLMLGLFTVISSCGDDDEPKKVFASPTIEITSPADLSGLQALVASPITLTLVVEAEASLSSVSLDGNNIKTYSQGEVTDSFDYEYIPSDNGTVNLVFVVEDAEGTTTQSVSVAIEGVGNPGFLLADFGGSEGSSVALSSIDPEFWDADRVITTFDVNGSLTTSATHENVNNQFTVEMGKDNPDANAPLEYQGKAMKTVKQPAPWGTDGWSHILLDFEAEIDQSVIEALPQVNEDLTGLTTGTKVVQLDVYFDDTQDPNIAFADLLLGDDPFGADRDKGYLIDLTLTKQDIHRFNQDGAGMYIGYKAYITEPNKWLTLTFDELDLPRVANFLAAGDPSTESPASNEVDAARIIPGGGYGDGQSPNAIYFRNLRIVDVQ